MTIDEFRVQLIEDAKVDAHHFGTGTAAAFASIVAEYLVQANVITEYNPAYYLGEGKRRAKIRTDGYAFDEWDFTMNIMVVHFNGLNDNRRLTRTEAASIFEWPLRFVDETLTNNLRDKIEISTPAADLADLLFSNRGRIQKYKLLLVTDMMMSDRIDRIESRDIGGIPVECHIWDIGRIYNVCVKTGAEHVTIDFDAMIPGGIPCLEASVNSDESYKCYLCVLPGNVLADLYDRWGGQLLEGNVRSFLSTKVAVNKQIRETILRSPSKFFAYNNGVSATAVGVKVVTRDSGKFITHAEDFQIINGGQTTASLSNARFRDKASLDEIMVQMKLTEIKDRETAEEMVQQIARSSNSQNKVSDADFFSNHPFHINMEQASRRVFAPAVGGAQYDTRWFYERARGQFLQAQMRMTPSEKKRFLLQNPKRQVITKTDLAKVVNTWRGRPHIVSKGAQTNFADFAAWIDEQWAADADQFNDHYFREVVALFILFKHVERLVTQQPWYQHGYRANIVTYSIALLAHLIGKQFPKKTLDLQHIWSKQEVPAELTEELIPIIKAVMKAITDPERGVINVTQWCKREDCWTSVKSLELKLSSSLEHLLVDITQVRADKREAKKDQRLIAGVDAQTKVIELGKDFWMDLASFLATRRLATASQARALTVACQLPAKIPNPYQAKLLLELIERARSEGYSA